MLHRTYAAITILINYTTKIKELILLIEAFYCQERLELQNYLIVGVQDTSFFNQSDRFAKSVGTKILGATFGYNQHIRSVQSQPKL